MAIFNSTLNTTFTTVFSSPLSFDSTAVTAIYLCNKGVGVASVNVHLVPSGDLASDSNIIYYDLKLAPSDTYVIDSERIILDQGDSIVAVSDVAGDVVATVTYMGI